MIFSHRTRQRRQFRYPYRRRQPGLLWALFSLLGLGALAGLLLGVREARRRSETAREDVPPPEREAEGDREDYAEAAPPESLSVWISGPQGNLFVRDGGAGHGVPILLLHSLAGNGGQWALQLDHLRRHRRAVAIDLRGHGDSDPADDGDYSIPAFAADVAAAVDQLDLRHFVLAGHSLGAAVAIEYASRHPERVVGLLLIDPNGDQTRVPREQMETFLEALREDPLGELDSYFRQLLLHGDRDASRWVLEDIRLTHEDAVAKAVEGSIEYAPLPALARYEGPKLAILSDMNNLPYSLHRLVPDLPVRFMPGTGHWMMMDRPEVFNGLLDELLAGVDGTA